MKPKKIPAKATPQPGSSAKPKTPRAASAKAKNVPEIPAILLEGDSPAPQPAHGPGHKFAVGSEPRHVAFMGEAGELPEAYGTRTLLLTARDPHWLYAHWDLTTEQLREYNALSRDKHLILRVYVDTVRGEPFTEIHVHPESRNWFVHVGRGGTRFVAELGFYQKSGNWQTVSISGATLTPPDKISDDTSVRFETIPVDVPFDLLLQQIKRAAQQHLPLAEAIDELRHMGFSDLPAPESVASARWTPEQERELARVVSMDQVRRVWMGSLEITELIRRQLLGEWSSAALARGEIPGSWSGAVSSFSSPWGGIPGRSFWFNVNAELIVYGSTEPDAEVTIGGRRIQLRPDGSFSFRFALPDGAYELPAIAVSADRVDSRGARLHFSRTTHFQGDVGVHPQDPQLKTPHPANV